LFVARRAAQATTRYDRVAVWWAEQLAGALLATMTVSPGTGAPAVAPAEGSELLGQPAPPWDAGPWFNSPPLRLEQLRGKVVLVRWFMSPGCPLCSATAPALNQLWRAYKDRGLVVVGMYHHKDPQPLDPAAVRGYIRHFGYEFPVAIDPNWRTVKRWWLDGHERSYTSVSFLIGRDGRIRHIHRGGRLAPDGADFTLMKRKIEQLLDEGR
jgi:peroxiredoxin